MVFDISQIDAGEIQRELDEARDLASCPNRFAAAGVAKMFQETAVQEAFGLLGEHRGFGGIAAKMARSAVAHREVEQNALGLLAAGGLGYGGAAKIARSAAVRPSDWRAMFGGFEGHLLKDTPSQSWGVLDFKSLTDTFGAASQLRAAAVPSKAWQSALAGLEPMQDVWKPILMRWSGSRDGILGEDWSLLKRQLSFAARPTAMSVLDDLRASGGFQSAAMQVRIMEIYKTDFGVARPFGAEFLNGGLSWSGVAAPMPRPWYPPFAPYEDLRPEPAPSELQPSPGTGQTPSIRSLADLETVAEGRPLITREGIVRVANHPWTITIGGTVIGETIFLIVTHYLSP